MISNNNAVRLRTLTWHRYRAFKDRQQLSLAPINLIIGKNGSGKSVVSRLPILLAGAVSEQAEGPLDLTSGSIQHAASFEDLVYARGALPFTLGMSVKQDRCSYEFETTLRYIKENRGLSIENFKLTKDSRLFFSAEILNEDQLLEQKPLFRVNGPDSVPTTLELNFAGIVPEPSSLEDSLASHLDQLLQLFRVALPMPSYLGPFRAEPIQAMRIPNQGIRDLGPRGERALEFLADDKLRRGGELCRKVSDWFTAAMGQEILVDVRQDLPQVRVVDAGGSFEGSLADTGAGFAQCLPVVVQHLAHRAGRLKSPVLIVEQPELHLHPAAHGALADLVIGSATTGSGCQPSAICIVETHSEQFIMRIRRRIAEGSLPPQLVTVWSLGHVDAEAGDAIVQPLKVISFDARGNPSSWPTGVFEETLEDLTAMRRSARDRGL